jgi:hypothetical protein
VQDRAQRFAVSGLRPADLAALQLADVVRVQLDDLAIVIEDP